MRKNLYFVLMLVLISSLVLVSLLIFPHFFTQPSTPTSTSLEYVISQRRSFHAWDAAWDKSILLSSDLMKTVCKSAFSSGFKLSGITLYWANSTACYRYNQTTNSFVLHVSGDKRPQLASDVNQPVDNAPCIVIIIWDNQTEINHFAASRKSGFIVQNLYLVAVRNNLGGCCVGAGMYREDMTANIQAHLNLAPNLKPMYLFPIGFLKEGFSYPTGSLQPTSGNLPSPLESDRDILDVFNEKKDLATAWGDALSLQKLSNLLWSMYGYSLLGTGHRTVPSSYGVYPFQIYVCNASGTYNYIASAHSLSKINSIDKRATIVAHAGAPTYMKDAPVLVVVCWNSLGGSSNASDSDSKGRFINTNVGCCFQNLYLSANVWNISISEIAYTTNYEALRNDITDPLPSSVYPMYLVGVGEPKVGYSLNLHVKDWDLTDSIQGAHVYKDSDVKVSDTNGWTNWTQINGTVQVKVKYFGFWVNGSFSVTMDTDKTINVRCKLYDATFRVKDDGGTIDIADANVTVYNSTSLTHQIKSGVTNSTGQVRLTNLPNNTLSVAVYPTGSNYTIANVTREIINDECSPANVNTTPFFVSFSHPATKSIHEVKLDVNATFNIGTNLTVRFYSYSNELQAETIVWNGTTPAPIELYMNLSHPLGLPVEIVELALLDNGEEIFLVARFVVSRFVLAARLAELQNLWVIPGADRPALFRKMIAIDGQWPYAPP